MILEKPDGKPEAGGATPWWLGMVHHCDGLEASPIVEYVDGDGMKFCEPIDDPEGAFFWSLFGHLREGGVECFEDFSSEPEALEFARKLYQEYPNLRTQGEIFG